MALVTSVEEDRQGVEFASVIPVLLWVGLAAVATLSVFLLAGPNNGLAAPMLLGSSLFYKIYHLAPSDLHVAVNCVVFVLAVFVLTRVTARTTGAGTSSVAAAAIVLTAGSLGALPFYVALESADIFAPMLLIVLSVLAVFSDRLVTWELVSLVLLGAVSTLLHPSLAAVAWLGLPLVLVVSLSIKSGGAMRAIASALIIATIGAMGLFLTPSNGSEFSVTDLGVLGSLLVSDPLVTLSGLMKATLDQANRYDVGAIMSQAVRESAWMGAVSFLHTSVYALSALLVVVLMILPQRSPPLRVRGCVGMMLGGVLINALVCGLIPDGSSQHGARVAFLLPMALAYLMIFFASERDVEEM